LIAAVATFLATTDARGGPLRTFGAARAVAADGTGLPPAWNRFLSAPDAWSYWSPPFTLDVRRTIWGILNGDPAAIAVNPMIDYLEWRRDLNPARFDRYHPFLGPRLGRLVPPVVLAPLTGVPTDPVVEPPITPLAPLTIPPLSVPEPSGLLLIGLVSAVGLWRRSRTTPRPK
jgi:hypothetical protein